MWLLYPVMRASDFRYFSDISVSQGSVATRLRCGGQSMKLLLETYYWISQWKSFENWSAFGEVMGKIIVAPVFLLTVYIYLYVTRCCFAYKLCYFDFYDGLTVTKSSADSLALRRDSFMFIQKSEYCYFFRDFYSPMATVLR